MASLLNTVYAVRLCSNANPSNPLRSPQLATKPSCIAFNRRRFVVRATETDTNEVRAKVPDKAPAENGSSFNQILGIKGAKQETNKWKIRVQLTKPVTWPPLIWGVVCGAAASGNFHWTVEDVAKSIVCMMMSGPFLTGYTQTINDWYDREIDAINEPYRPIPSGAISENEVITQIWVLLLGGLGLAGLLDVWAGHNFPTIFYLAVGGSLLSYIYSAPPLKLKQNGWIGNFALGASYISLPWWAGQALFGTLTPGFAHSVVQCVKKLESPMAAATLVVNGDVAAVKAQSTGRYAAVYSEVQNSRLDHPLPLPSVLKNRFKVVDGPPSSAAGNPDEIAKLFPCVFGQPSANLVPGDSSDNSGQKLKIGVVLSGGQAPGGHNVISGIFDYLQDRCKGSTLYGFRGGPAGIMKCKYVVLTSEYIYPYRNQGGFDMIASGRDKIETPEQFKLAQETAIKLDLDGLVVIGGDDSNTNACLLAENFRSANLKTKVIGCPKTIDGDLKCKEVPTSFGFDTACKIYAEMIGNVMIDARSTGKYYHFVRLMGRAASHITLECALQTHPNITLIGEEVAAKKETLKNVTDYIADVICKREELGYNYGVILIPEGLIDFIPEVQQLISELNEILAHETVDEAGVWKKKLTSQSAQLFELLPPAIQEQLMLERDPHGNVQVAKIETEKMLIQMVETELEVRKQGSGYKGQFKGQSHFFGYEGRCGLPSNFDATYCYALGYGAGALLQSGKTGLISSVGNLAAPVAEWTVGGTALTSLMDVERRHGKFKPVIKKAMVELDGAPFKKFVSMREEWALKNRYLNPGPIQFVGPTSDKLNHTLLLELGA